MASKLPGLTLPLVEIEAEDLHIRGVEAVCQHILFPRKGQGEINPLDKFVWLVKSTQINL